MMRDRWSKLWLVFGIVALGCGVVRAQDMSKFTGFYYSPTTGKVGYHMDSEGYFDPNSLPCDNNEEMSVQDMKVSGVVPPGLTTLDANKDKPQFGFEGTPRQAGDWAVTVTYVGVHCGFHPPYYGDRTTYVRFHIDP